MGKKQNQDPCGSSLAGMVRVEINAATLQKGKNKQFQRHSPAFLAIEIKCCS